MTTTYIFPGLISQAHGFRKVDNNSAQIRTSYKMVEDAYAKVLADSKLTPGTFPANSERHLDTNNEYFVEALYGDRNPRVTVSADNLTPLFDYKGEVDYAKFAHGEMVLRLQAQLDQLSPDTSENRLAETQPDAASQPTADEVKVR